MPDIYNFPKNTVARRDYTIYMPWMAVAVRVSGLLCSLPVNVRHIHGSFLPSQRLNPQTTKH